jgi:hypothetical protein
LDRLLVKRSDVLKTLERGRQPAEDPQTLDVPGDRTILIG